MLEHDLAASIIVRADRGPLDIVLLESCHLPTLARVHVVAPDVLDMRFGSPFVAQIVHLAAMPHRQRVGPFPLRDAARFARLQMNKPHIGCHAATVAFPGASVR